MKQFLSFCLNAGIYAIPIESVESVVQVEEFIDLPKTSPYVKGLLNLRGEAVIVVDLKKKFGIPDKAVNASPSVIVMNIESKAEAGHEPRHFRIGVITDSVNEVIDLNEDIEDIGDTGITIDRSLIQGIGKRENKFIIILRPEAMFDEEEKRAADSSLTA